MSDYLDTQAIITASTYLEKAREEIDRLFGKDYASQYPQLVAAFMQAAASDFHTRMLCQPLVDVAKGLGDLVEVITYETQEDDDGDGNDAVTGDEANQKVLL